MNIENTVSMIDFSWNISCCQMIKQTQIDTIINSGFLYKEKLHQLKLFFEQNKISYFCDFDDTITKNTCLFYSKFNYLTKKKKKSFDNVFSTLHNYFRINPVFVALVQQLWIKEIVLVSSNNLEFLTKMIHEKRPIFERLWFSIIGIIAKTSDFDFWPKDKINVLPQNAIYISDIFEYKNFLWNDWFVCVDTYSLFNYYYILWKKMFFYVLFLIRYG